MENLKQPENEELYEETGARKDRNIAMLQAFMGTVLDVINSVETKPFTPNRLMGVGLAIGAGAAKIAAIKKKAKHL
jgi:hypothetical protein